MKFVKKLKGGSLSKTAVYTDGSNKWVRKSIFLSLKFGRRVIGAGGGGQLLKVNLYTIKDLFSVEH